MTAILAPAQCPACQGCNVVDLGDPRSHYAVLLRRECQVTSVVRREEEHGRPE